MKTRALLPALLLLALPARAALTTITDTIYRPDGTAFSGVITITLNSPQRAQPLHNGAGVTLTGLQRRVTVTAGEVSLTLEANDAITPGGTSYTASYQPSSGAPWNETWIVPTSASPLKIHDLRSTTLPSPSTMISPQQISGGSAMVGQALVWNGTIYAPATVGGGASGKTWDQLTAISWDQLQ